MAISIKAARVNAGFTQTDVAERVGKTKNTIASYEAYTTIPDISVAKADPIKAPYRKGKKA